MDKLIELMNSSLISGGVIAVLASWLANRARTRQDQQTKIGALPVHADAVTVTVAELQASVSASQLLWEGPVEHAVGALLAVLVSTADTAQARINGETDTQSLRVGLGPAVERTRRCAGSEDRAVHGRDGPRTCRSAIQFI
ncbi:MULTISPECIES: hypothetical protein [unclassified Streptomyces]|uniref:Uncharacterized protein n=1 Tax=Streptomyces sp. NBC_00060 TaxID=2975636 RepID=A0AAU2HCN0_9ACTN